MKNEKYDNLINNFKIISKKGWLKTVATNTSGVGLTFERQLNKQPDSLFFPDYRGTEIKCTTRYSRYPITLFSLAFDGPSLYEMNNLLQKYGKNDRKYKDKKTLMANLKINNPTLVNDKYFFELKLDYNSKKLLLVVYDVDFNVLENEVFIDFDTIKTHLEVKLSSLALVYASKKVIDGIDHYRYYSLNIYELISFEKFLHLLENNIINVSIEGRISRSGFKEGKNRNKNLVFKIPKENISDLFCLIYEKDMDKIKNNCLDFTVFNI